MLPMNDVLGYHGRNVIVTGAASGMGSACAAILHDLGARVIGLDINEAGSNVDVYTRVDLRDTDSIAAAANTIAAPIHALFSCAGLPGPPFSDIDVMLVNFVGARQLIEALVPKMPGGSAIAWIASMGGLGWQEQLSNLLPFVQTPDFATGRSWCESHPDVIGPSAYAFSKQAINAWVAWRSYSLVRDGIRLNCLNPGPTDTPMMPYFEDGMGKDFMDNFPRPIGRNASPEEQAWPLVMLNSPRCSYVAGEAFHVDGGFLAAMTTGQLDFSALATADPTPEGPG